MTAMQWIRETNRQQNSQNERAEKITRIDSSVASLLTAIDLRDKAQKLNIGFQLEQAEGLINMRARAARVRILQRAFNSLCEVSR